jgi:hypothetical protein
LHNIFDHPLLWNRVVLLLMGTLLLLAIRFRHSLFIRSMAKNPKKLLAKAFTITTAIIVSEALARDPLSPSGVVIFGSGIGWMLAWIILVWHPWKLFWGSLVK